MFSAYEESVEAVMVGEIGDTTPGGGGGGGGGGTNPSGGGPVSSYSCKVLFTYISHFFINQQCALGTKFTPFSLSRNRSFIFQLWCRNSLQKNTFTNKFSKEMTIL